VIVSKILMTSEIFSENIIKLNFLGFSFLELSFTGFVKRLTASFYILFSFTYKRYELHSFSYEYYQSCNRFFVWPQKLMKYILNL